METIVQMTVKEYEEQREKIRKEAYQQGIKDSATHTLTTHRYWGAKVMTNDETVRLISETLIEERKKNQQLEYEKDYLNISHNVLIEINRSLKKNRWKFWK